MDREEDELIASRKKQRELEAQLQGAEAKSRAS